MNVQARIPANPLASLVSLPVLGAVSATAGAADFAQQLQRASQGADAAARGESPPPAPTPAAARPAPPPARAADRNDAGSAEPAESAEEGDQATGNDRAADEAVPADRSRTARHPAERGAQRHDKPAATGPGEAPADAAAAGDALLAAEGDAPLDTTAGLDPAITTLPDGSPLQQALQAPLAVASSVDTGDAAAAPPMTADGAATPTANPGSLLPLLPAASTASTGAPADAAHTTAAALSASASFAASAASADATASAELSMPAGSAALPEGFTPMALPTEWRAALASATGAAAGTATAGPVRTEQIEAAVGSAEFGASLGTRISVLARDGIEQARLNLHPAELGPIALRLVLDGTQVRVDMAAESGTTRQALEQSLPALASALRDAGFTLSGGGVFQQPRDEQPAQPRGEGIPGGRAGMGEEMTEGVVAPARQASPRGLVDLFA